MKTASNKQTDLRTKFVQVCFGHGIEQLLKQGLSDIRKQYHVVGESTTTPRQVGIPLESLDRVRTQLSLPCKGPGRIPHRLYRKLVKAAVLRFVSFALTLATG